MTARILFALALFIVGALTASPGLDAMGAPGGTNAYILGPGDTIDVMVVGEHELSQTLTIKPDGSIDLALVGEVAAAGRTTTQLAAELKARYSKYLIAPSITVSVHTFRVDYISILGQVNRPGEYPIRPGEGILELLASAGGPTSSADLTKATIIRGKAPTGIPDPIEVNLLEAFAKNESTEARLLAGDVLVVPASDRRIVVLGQVNRPGAYDLLPGQRVSDLLAAAGGASPRAELQRAFIVRGTEQIPVNLREILVGNLEANIPVQAGDMMVVPEPQDQIAVLGAVNRPGKYDLADGTKLIDAIALAGGQSPTGNLDQVAIVRLEGGKTKTISAHLDRALRGQDMSQNILLKPGDVVYVAEQGVTLEKVGAFFSTIGVIRILFGGF